MNLLRKEEKDKLVEDNKEGETEEDEESEYEDDGGEIEVEEYNEI